MSLYAMNFNELCHISIWIRSHFMQWIIHMNRNILLIQISQFDCTVRNSLHSDVRPFQGCESLLDWWLNSDAAIFLINACFAMHLNIDFVFVWVILFYVIWRIMKSSYPSMLMDKRAAMFVIVVMFCGVVLGRK